MLVKEKKYNIADLTYDSNHLLENSNNFIILDDKTIEIDENVKKIFSLIESYGYKLDIVDIEQMAEIIIKRVKESNIVFDSVITVGTGGLQLYKSIKNNPLLKDKNIYNIKWNRLWQKDKSLGFETDLEKYKISNKTILLLEDVIASGNTLWTLKEELESSNNKIQMVACALIQESSSLLRKSFSNTFSSMMICKPSNEKLDPFWYPPIYSLRHLFYGDEEMEQFYETLNEKYFNNDKLVETNIKALRRSLNDKR